MKQIYKVFTINSNEDKAKYYQECIDQGIVNLVVTSKQKYATVEWDLITLDNSTKMRKDDKRCSLENDIRDLYESYIQKENFTKVQLTYQIQNCCGIIYIYKKDIEEFLPLICKLIDDILKSDCIEYTTVEEKYKNIPDELKKYIGNKNLELD